MSDITNDEVREILDGIRARTNNSDIDDETVRKWSREDIDRLLAATRREGETVAADDGEKPTEESIYVEEEAFDGEQEEVSSEFSDYTDDEQSESEEKPEPVKAKGVSVSVDDVKEKLSPLAGKVKGIAKKLGDLLKSEPTQEEEERFILDDEDEFEEASELSSEAAEENDDDMKIADFSSSKKDEKADKAVSEEKTTLIENPDTAAKEDNESVEEEPDEDVKIPKGEKPQNDLQSKLQEAQETGQIVIGEVFKRPTGEKPAEVEESEAERELFEKRKKKIDYFVLFGDESDPYGSENEKEKIGELFETHEERPVRKEKVEFEGVEYDDEKDARRVRKYLNAEKKKSLRRLTSLGVLLAAATVTGVVSSAVTTVAGDRILTILVNILISALALAVSNQTIVKSLELLKKKQFTINTVISAASIVCFMQTFLMFILYFLGRNSVSVFGGTGVALLLLSELNNYIMHGRTVDAVELCSGENKDKLYSIESISDDKDIFELGKNVRAASPRIRYSCKTRFPSHLVEMCMSETSADKRSRLLLIVLGVMSLINFIVAWAVSKSFAVGFAAFTITLSMSVPSYGALLTQLPLRWVNKRINRMGAMVSCQEAVNELYRTNAIVLDSRDLFDQGACSMVSFKDFKNVRMDDAMLYAAAMVIRSGGPLTGVFDQMFVNRRDILPTVKSFSYEEKLGVSGWIYNQKVILGNRALMENHNVDVPSTEEDKYLMRGNEIIYLAIAHKLAAMIVVNYAPNKKLAPYLKRLRDSGVSILVRNCDQNVTERMISTCYDMRLDNIKIINSSSGRVFKKYKSRPKVATRAVAIHDGSTYTLLRSLCTSAMLSHTFKITDILTFIGVGMGFAIVLVLSILNVIADLPAVFVILLQIVITGAFVGVTRITCGK